MTLKEHIESYSRKCPTKSPRAEEVDRIARKFHVTRQCVYNWARGAVNVPEYIKDGLRKMIKGLDI